MGSGEINNIPWQVHSGGPSKHQPPELGWHRLLTEKVKKTQSTSQTPVSTVNKRKKTLDNDNLTVKKGMLGSVHITVIEC